MINILNNDTRKKNLNFKSFFSPFPLRQSAAGKRVSAFLRLREWLISRDVPTGRGGAVKRRVWTAGMPAAFNGSSALMCKWGIYRAYLNSAYPSLSWSHSENELGTALVSIALAMPSDGYLVATDILMTSFFNPVLPVMVVHGMCLSDWPKKAAGPIEENEVGGLQLNLKISSYRFLDFIIRFIEQRNHSEHCL